MSRLTDSMVIEDDDGFKTVWPFPDASSLLHQGDFISLAESLHEEAREAWLAAGGLS